MNAAKAPLVITPQRSVRLGVSSTDPAERLALVRRVQSVEHWYHTIDLPYGVTTPGYHDHRSAVSRYGLPETLQGRHALDIAAFDGFWAFEMESREAASVTAVDLERMSQCDRPPRERMALLSEGDCVTGQGFQVAHQALESQVKRLTFSIYDLSPKRLGRSFDFVFCGDVLVHLRDPNLALERIHGVTDGDAIFAEPFDRSLGERPALSYLGGRRDATWWLPSIAAWEEMIRNAGFSAVTRHDVFRLDLTDGSEGYWRAVFHARA